MLNFYLILNPIQIGIIIVKNNVKYICMVLVWSLTVKNVEKPAESAGLRAIGGGHEMGLEAFRSLPNPNKCAYFFPFLPDSSCPFHFVWSFVWSRNPTKCPLPKLECCENIRSLDLE